MEGNYKSKRPLGSFTAKEIVDKNVPLVQKFDGLDWSPSRPIPYWSIPSRIKMSLDVFVGKADALYW